jgi:hypothetical protein
MPTKPRNVCSRDLKLARLEGSTTRKDTPRDARELVGKRDRKDVVMQPFPGSLDTTLEPVCPRVLASP